MIVVSLITIMQKHFSAIQEMLRVIKMFIKRTWIYLK